jgi:hypothetical protein
VKYLQLRHYVPFYLAVILLYYFPAIVTVSLFLPFSLYFSTIFPLLYPVFSLDKWELDTLSMKEKNSLMLGRLNTDGTTRREGPPSSIPQQGQNVNQRSRAASGYTSNVNDGSSVVGVNDWMQPKGPMAGGSSSVLWRRKIER